MNKTNTGGSAFPSPSVTLPNGDVMYGEFGMTLRDYFAAHADVSIYRPLESLTDKLHRRPTNGEMAEYIASIRAIEADAMLKAREA